ECLMRSVPHIERDVENIGRPAHELPGRFGQATAADVARQMLSGCYRKDAGQMRTRDAGMLGHHIERQLTVPETGLDEPDGLEHGRHEGRPRMKPALYATSARAPLDPRCGWPSRSTWESPATGGHPRLSAGGSSRRSDPA